MRTVTATLWMTLQALPFFADPLLPVLVDLAARATVWLLLTALAARLARTAAGRHLAHTAGLLGVLVLPLAAIVVPTWTMSLLPAAPRPQSAVAVELSPQVPKAATAEATPAPSRTAVVAPAAAATVPPDRATGREWNPSPAPAPSASAPNRLPTLLWLLGAGVVLAGLGVDRLARFRLAHSARAVDDPTWGDEAVAVAADLGARAPRLLVSPSTQVPMTWGTRRPVLVLPSAALAWGPEHRRYALIHEVAHARRGDALLFALARLACALAWFHPLVWWAAGRQRAESELACDDRVVAAGASPASYAGELLALARRLRPASLSTAAALARPAGLGERVRAILDGRRDRTALPAGRVLAALVLAGALALPAVAGIRLTHREAASPLPVEAVSHWVIADGASEDSVDAPPTPPTPPANPAPPRAPESPAAPPAAPSAPSAPTAPAAPAVSAAPAHRAAPSPPPPPVPPRVTAAPSAPAAPAPPAAPAAPAAPGVPVPDGFLHDCPGERSTHGHADDDVWDWTVKTDHCRFELRMRGKVAFLDDETGIRSLGRDASFSIEDRRPGVHRALRIEPGPGDAQVWQWKVDGVERPVDAAARAWLAEMIPVMFRATGLAAEARTRRILARGGPDAVFAEIEMLQSDYVRRCYLIALIDAAPLDDSRSLRWVRLAGATVDSDYELASTLTKLPAEKLADVDIQSAFVEAARTIQSDYEMRRALTPLVDSPALSPHVLPVIVELAADIQSDYELATLLCALADRYAATSEVPEAFFQAARTIDSDYELARTLRKALEHPLSADALTGLLDTALSIDSDYELANVLVTAAAGQTLDAPARQAFERALGTIGGEYERERVRRAIGS
jgi:beta-lactamase regulating signal transducer with metallopeptidase domain